VAVNCTLPVVGVVNVKAGLHAICAFELNAAKNKATIRSNLVFIIFVFELINLFDGLDDGCFKFVSKGEKKN